MADQSLLLYDRNSERTRGFQHHCFGEQAVFGGVFGGFAFSVRSDWALDLAPWARAAAICLWDFISHPVSSPNGPKARQTRSYVLEFIGEID